LHLFARKTRIVCTLGPGCDGQLDKLIAAGMNAARFNMSHGSLESHSKRLGLLRHACKKTSANIALIADIKGPKIRTGTFRNGSVELVEGERVVLKAGNAEGGNSGGSKIIFVNYPNLLETLAHHRIVYFADGLLEVKVEHADKNDAIARVITGGKLGDCKGVNIPGAHLVQSTFGEKDWQDVHWAVKNNFDYIAQSFVRSAKDVQKLRQLLEHFKGEKHTHIIAKIEDHVGLEKIDEIIAKADAVMVARGDLGVQIPVEDVPRAQKSIIARCNAAGKPVITATQMLESMTNSPFPTRAEVSDVANAILDGSDAVMLSGETAAGKYALRTVETMARIASHAEQHMTCEKKHLSCTGKGPKQVACAVAEAACRAAERIDATAIAAFTETGGTAFLISAFRPCTGKIIAVTPLEKTARWLALCRGTEVVHVKTYKHVSETTNLVSKTLREHNCVPKGSQVVVVAGTPGNTRFMRIVDVK